jgi:signal transduction histidine kinase
MNRQVLEPRLLSIFRLYIGLRLGFLALSGFVFLAEGGDLFTPTMAPYVVLFLVDIAFLLFFLYWPWLQRHMGRMYLPLALTVASVVPISEANYLYAIYGAWNVARLWVLFPFLSVPLILTAWQYSFREVVIFCFATAAFELLLVITAAEQDAMRFLSEGAMVLTRTALFLLIGYIVSILVTAQRRQREALAQANRQLVLYAATLEQLAISRERNRLARELHDTLAHTLSGLVVQLDAIATLWTPTPPKASAMLEQALTQTRAGLDETRRALRDLRATRLEDLGLGQALSEMAKNVAVRDGLSLDLDIAEEIADLPAEVEQAYYRVAQEALENAARHAEASHISVSLRQRDGELVLTIADDGRGFGEGAQLADQFGLRGMRERAELIGGQMEVESQPGRGTRISLRSAIPKVHLPTIEEEP